MLPTLVQTVYDSAHKASWDASIVRMYKRAAVVVNRFTRNTVRNRCEVWQIWLVRETDITTISGQLSLLPMMRIVIIISTTIMMTLSVVGLTTCSRPAMLSFLSYDVLDTLE